MVQVGTKVRCRILSVKGDGKINIGLAKKYFPEDETVVEEVEEEEESDDDDEDVEMEEEIAEVVKVSGCLQHGRGFESVWCFSSDE